jgi:hypothetical protein
MPRRYLKMDHERFPSNACLLTVKDHVVVMAMMLLIQRYINWSSNTRCRFSLEELVVIQLIKELPHFVDHDDSLSCSQNPSSDIPEPTESTPSQTNSMEQSP